MELSSLHLTLLIMLLDRADDELRAQEEDDRPLGIDLLPPGETVATVVLQEREEVARLSNLARSCGALFVFLLLAWSASPVVLAFFFPGLAASAWPVWITTTLLIPPLFWLLRLYRRRPYTKFHQRLTAEREDQCFQTRRGQYTTCCVLVYSFVVFFIGLILMSLMVVNADPFHANVAVGGSGVILRNNVLVGATSYEIDTSDGTSVVSLSSLDDTSPDSVHCYHNALGWSEAVLTLLRYRHPRSDRGTDHAAVVASNLMVPRDVTRGGTVLLVDEPLDLSDSLVRDNVFQANDSSVNIAVIHPDSDLGVATLSLASLESDLPAVFPPGSNKVEAAVAVSGDADAWLEVEAEERGLGDIAGAYDVFTAAGGTPDAAPLATLTAAATATSVISVSDALAFSTGFDGLFPGDALVIDGVGAIVRVIDRPSDTQLTLDTPISAANGAAVRLNGTRGIGPIGPVSVSGAIPAPGPATKTATPATWTDIMAAAEVGDVIALEPGTYTDSVIISVANVAITAADANAWPSITGTVTIRAPNATLHSLDFLSPYGYTWIFVDAAGQGARIEQCSFDASGLSVTAVSVWSYAAYHGIDAVAEDVAVRHCTFHYCYGRFAINTGGARSRIEANTMIGASTMGMIAVPGATSVIRGNIISNAWGGFAVVLDQCVVEGNVVLSTGATTEHPFYRAAQSSIAVLLFVALIFTMLVVQVITLSRRAHGPLTLAKQ